MAGTARLLHGLICAAGVLIGAQATRADGIYLSYDQSLDDRLAVISLDRGALTLAAAAGDDGYERWGRLALMQGWTVAGARLKLGPSLRVSSLEGAGFGLRIGADRYADHQAWGQFWMVEYDSIQRAGLGLASVNHKASGLGLEFSLWRQQDDPIKPSLMTSWKIPGRNLSARAGWRLEDREAFVGVSFSRF